MVASLGLLLLPFTSSYVRLLVICLFVHLFICSFIHFVFLFFYSFVFLFICSFIHLFIYSFVYLFICSFVFLFICSFVFLFICSFVFLFICSFVHLFIYVVWGVQAWEGMGQIMEREQSYRDASDHYEMAWKFEAEASPSMGCAAPIKLTTNK